MEFLDDPEEMTPEQRLTEVAAILASAYLRLRQSSLRPAGPFTEKPLDCSGGALPLCVEGLTGREPTPVEVAR